MNTALVKLIQLTNHLLGEILGAMCGKNRGAMAILKFKAFL